MQRWKHGLAAAAAAVALLLGMALTTPATVRAAPAAATDEAVVVESDDVRALVAPVALHPDPILALVLQASTLPLQVVQAERFLSRREKDPKLEPDPDWDKSIVGLLNYPGQLRSMSEYIDWTEELGNAVVDRLDEVQQEIQDIRLAAYDAGFLKSNERQKVEVRDDQVRITSTDAKKISIPQYDPAALLTALDEAEEAEEAEEVAEEAPPPAPAPAPAAQPAAPVESAAAPAVDAGTVAPATAPAVVPVEAVTPPVITYGQPENSFWGDAATFAGGAVVGGLLGWGLTEAFDDDDDNDGFDDDDWDNEDVQEALRERREYSEERREDVVAARDERRDDRQGTGEDRAARARQQLNERPQAVGGRTRPAAAAAGKPRASQARAERGRRDVRLPGGGTQAGVQDKVRKRSAAVQPAQATGKPSATRLPSSQQKRAQASAGYAATRDHQGIAASAGSRQEVRSEADRGARSRVAQVGGGQSRATPAAVSRGGGDRVVARADRGGGGIAADRNRGAVAAADGARGRASRGGGGGGGGAGGGGGGGGLRNR